MGSIDIPPKFIPVPPKPRRSISERIADAIESVQLYAARKIFIDAQLAERGGVPRIKFKDTLVPVMYADRDGFLQPMGWEGWTAQLDFTITETALGTFIADVSPGLGQEMKIIAAIMIGTNAAATMQITRMEAPGGTLVDIWADLASAVNNVASVPRGFTSTTTNRYVDTTSELTRTISGVNALRFAAGASAANTDVYQIIAYFRLKHKNQFPVVTTGGSATFTVTAGSIVPVIIE